VAVAHHADDQAETVLMHLLRGSGLDGLVGMLPESALPGYDRITLLRPLLHVTRAGIEAYCRRHSIVPHEDATNADTTATRNWVRHVLLPLIETRYPGAPRALTDLADNAARDVEVLNDATLEWTDHIRVDGREISLERYLFRRAREAVQRRLIRWSANMLSPGVEISHERTEAVVRLFLNGRKGQRVELPGGVVATVDKTTARLTRLTP
jgi:tRNA(Ile)-lysidine synthase